MYPFSLPVALSAENITLRRHFCLLFIFKNALKSEILIKVWEMHARTYETKRAELAVL